MATRDQSRRDFIKSLTVAGAAASVLPAGGFAGVTGNKPTFRAGAIGIGSRGTRIVTELRQAAERVGVNVDFVALADVDSAATERVGQELGVPEKHRFTGFDGYRKLLEVPMDIVCMATPPNFRPLHFEAAVEAGCHCFIEKPVAVDAPGARRMYAAGEKAKEKGLSIVAGTGRRHNEEHKANARALHAGEYGRVLGGRLLWLGSGEHATWAGGRREGESAARYMARNWLNFVEMSGDFIVEQHVHDLDIANWYLNRVPRTALGVGGRARRKTGNTYDFFSLDFDYGEDCHIHSMCRQIPGTYGRLLQEFRATGGTVLGPGSSSPADIHEALLRSILEEKGLNEVRAVTDATVATIMGRISAYTGQIVRWIDLTERTDSQWYNEKLKPTAEDFETGNVVLPEEEIAPVPGRV